MPFLLLKKVVAACFSLAQQALPSLVVCRDGRFVAGFWRLGDRVRQNLHKGTPRLSWPHG